MKNPFSEINFPIYRKYVNDKNYFKIISEKEVEEIQVIGKIMTKRRMIAVQYPELVFIMDLCKETNNHIRRITEEEYQQMEFSFRNYNSL